MYKCSTTCTHIHEIRLILFAELTHGWWSITNIGHVDKLLRTLCIRGFREKSLYKALQKNKETIANSIDPVNLNECERSFKELLDAHRNNKLLPSVTSSNSSSSSSSDSDSDDDSSGEGAKSDSSEDEEVNVESSDKEGRGGEGVKDESDAGEVMDTAATNEQKVPGTSSEGKTSQEEGGGGEEKSDKLGVPSSHQRTEVEEGEGEGERRESGAITKRQCSSEVPSSGVYDPTYPSMTLYVAVKVMDYLEAVQQRLITASLAVEVSSIIQCTCVHVHVHTVYYRLISYHHLCIHVQ